MPPPRDDCIASTTRRSWRGRSGHPPPATRRIPEAHLTSKHPAVQRTRVDAARRRARRTSPLSLNARRRPPRGEPPVPHRQPPPAAFGAGQQPPPPPQALRREALHAAARHDNAAARARHHAVAPLASPTPPARPRQPAPSLPSGGEEAPPPPTPTGLRRRPAPAAARRGVEAEGAGAPAARVSPRSLAGATREGIRFRFECRPK
nr:uncharacterized protein LOC127310545 [Lolium perenne]